MKILIFFTILTSFAGNELLPFIFSTQQTAPQRYKGTWPGHISPRGQSLKMKETNIFVSIQMMNELSLLQLDEKFRISYENLKKSYLDQIDLYLQDRDLSQRPLGSMNFWPRQVLDDGRVIFNFTKDPKLLKLMNYLSIPNDFDTSAAFAFWDFHQGKGEFYKDFIDLVTQHSDPKTNAFQTWVRKSPIKVDCVVNLNILTTLNLNLENLSVATLKSRNQSCNYLKKIIHNEKVGTCSPYYDRSSQFYIAFSRANQKNSCFNLNDQNKVLELLQKDSIKKNTSMAQAEMLILWNQFNKNIRLSEKQLKIRAQLRNNIISSLKHSEKGPYLPSDSLFIGNVRGIWDWYSDAQSTLLAFMALNTDA